MTRALKFQTHHLALTILVPVVFILSGCATGGGASTANTINSPLSTPMPPKRATTRLKKQSEPNPILKSELKQKHQTQQPSGPLTRTQLPACKVKPDSVEWILVSGQCKNGYAQGKGEAKSIDGNRHYTGGFVAGRFSGEGTYDWGTGIRYSGQFSEGMREGQGTMDYPESRKYEGQFTANHYEGWGKYMDGDGSIYEGEFKDGHFSGNGTYRWISGDTYTGSFKQNQMHGSGKYVLANGEYYEGQFNTNEMGVKGSYHWPNGDTYKGRINNKGINGKGIYLSPDGSIYKGNFKDGLKHGWGRLITAEATFRQKWEEGVKVLEQVQ